MERVEKSKMYFQPNRNTLFLPSPHFSVTVGYLPTWQLATVLDDHRRPDSLLYRSSQYSHQRSTTILHIQRPPNVGFYILTSHKNSIIAVHKLFKNQLPLSLEKMVNCTKLALIAHCTKIIHSFQNPRIFKESAYHIQQNPKFLIHVPVLPAYPK